MKFCAVILCLLPLWLSGQSPDGFRAFGSTSNIPTKFSIHTNLAPMLIGEYSLGIQYKNHQHLSYSFSAGYAPEPKYGTLYKIEKLDHCDVGDGAFIKLGVDYFIKKQSLFSSLTSSIINPFIGARITTSRIHEIYLENLWDSIADDVYSINYGAAIVLGNQTNIYKRFSLRLGLQFGKDIIQNRKYQSYGYTPGLGIYWDSLRTQFVGELSYVIKRGQRVSRKIG